MALYSKPIKTDRAFVASAEFSRSLFRRPSGLPRYVAIFSRPGLVVRGPDVRVFSEKSRNGFLRISASTKAGAGQWLMPEQTRSDGRKAALPQPAPPRPSPTIRRTNDAVRTSHWQRAVPRSARRQSMRSSRQECSRASCVQPDGPRRIVLMMISSSLRVASTRMA
jgi:hypothetical protein